MTVRTTSLHPNTPTLKKSIHHHSNRWIRIVTSEKADKDCHLEMACSIILHRRITLHRGNKDSNHLHKISTLRKQKIHSTASPKVVFRTVLQMVVHLQKWISKMNTPNNLQNIRLSNLPQWVEETLEASNSVRHARENSMKRLYPGTRRSV